ncbi:hypothetical protein TGVAND_313890 [Toxoplasma gondii VAND]|uniref:Uncharacterized protein n=1 Tax=Toxoplasma gondii VAND TaxID=933077 RepID=A0A086QBD2_TOXGO|nr:hypothetical protein TGVAND_313890 [Toxoplasma gondii VAND]
MRGSLEWEETRYTNTVGRREVRREKRTREVLETVAVPRVLSSEIREREAHARQHRMVIPIMNSAKVGDLASPQFLPVSLKERPMRKVFVCESVHRILPYGLLVLSAPGDWRFARRCHCPGTRKEVDRFSLSRVDLRRPDHHLLGEEAGLCPFILCSNAIRTHRVLVKKSRLAESQQ